MRRDHTRGIDQELGQKVLDLAPDLALRERKDRQYAEATSQSLGGDGQRIMPSRPGEHGGSGGRTVRVEECLQRIEDVGDSLVLVYAYWWWAPDRYSRSALDRLSNGGIVEIDDLHSPAFGEVSE
jgi:hypothetical protein